MFVGALRAINGWATRNGLAAAMLAAGGKNCTCDLVVQNATEPRIDWRRNALFTGFGLAWIGAGQYFLFNRLFPYWLPGLVAARTLPAAAGAAFLDAGVHMPFLYLPVFYTLREFALKPELTLGGSVRAGMRFYREHVWTDAPLQFCIIYPTQLLNFKLNPPHLRVPTAVLAGAVWVSCLSFLRGNRSREDEKG